MTIIQYNDQGFGCPLAQCDGCLVIIMDPASALVVWEGPENTGSIFLCGKCDDAGSAYDMDSMALDQYLVFLLENLSLTGGRTEPCSSAGDRFGNRHDLKVTIGRATYTLVGDWPLSQGSESLATNANFVFAEVLMATASYSRKFEDFFCRPYRRTGPLLIHCPWA